MKSQILNDLLSGFYCDQCSKTYSTMNSLRSHKNKDCGKLKKIFKCTICTKGFARKWYLDHHNRTKHHDIAVSIFVETVSSFLSFIRYQAKYCFE